MIKKVFVIEWYASLFRNYYEILTKFKYDIPVPVAM